MKQPSLFFPLFLIVVGAIWLLRSMGWFPATSVIIAAVLVITGILTLLLDGINKQSVVSAPLLMYIGSVLYAVSEEGYMLKPLIAFGMIFAGCLMLLARSQAVPPKASRKYPPKP